jgi:hypothetical protein
VVRVVDRQVTKGPGSRAAGLAMAYKLIQSAHDRWRGVNGVQLVARVGAEASFRKRVLVAPTSNAPTTSAPELSPRDVGSLRPPPPGSSTGGLRSLSRPVRQLLTRI